MGTPADVVRVPNVTARSRTPASNQACRRFWREDLLTSRIIAARGDVARPRVVDWGTTAGTSSISKVVPFGKDLGRRAVTTSQAVIDEHEGGNSAIGHEFAALQQVGAALCAAHLSAERSGKRRNHGV